MIKSRFVVLKLFFSFGTEGHAVHYKSIYGNFTEAAKHKDGLCVVTIFAEVNNEPLFVI